MPNPVIQSTYAGEVLEQMLVRATTGNEIVEGGHIHIQPNIKQEFTIPRLRAGKMLQKRKEQPKDSDAKGEFKIDEKKLKPKDMMAFTTFNPRLFEHIWRPFQPDGNLVFRELSPEVQNQLLAEMAKVLTFELGYEYINGEEGDEEGKYFAGILTRIVNSTYVKRVSNPQAIQESNILNVFKSVIKLLPKPLKGQQFKKNVKLFCSVEDAESYDYVLTEKPYKGADYTNMNPERFKGYQVIPLADWPKDVVAAAYATSGVDSNFWAGVDYADDGEVIKIDLLENAGEKYFFKMLLKADTNIVFDEDIVLYDGRTESAAAKSTLLSDLAVSAGDLTPEFDPEIRQYSVNVANAVANTTITASGETEGQVIKLGGTALTSGTASAVQALEVGDNIFTISVLSADKTDADVYLVTVKRAEA